MSVCFMSVCIMSVCCRIETASLLVSLHVIALALNLFFSFAALLPFPLKRLASWQAIVVNKNLFLIDLPVKSLNKG